MIQQELLRQRDLLLEAITKIHNLTVNHDKFKTGMSDEKALEFVVYEARTAIAECEKG